MLRDTHSQKILDLLPGNVKDVMNEEDYIWLHDAIRRELDHILAKAHDDLYDLTRLGDQQDKATLLSTDTSIFSRIPYEHLYTSIVVITARKFSLYKLRKLTLVGVRVRERVCIVATR